RRHRRKRPRDRHAGPDPRKADRGGEAGRTGPRRALAGAPLLVGVSGARPAALLLRALVVAAARPALVEAADIAEHLLEEGQLAPRRRCGSRCGVDVAPVFQILVVNTPDHPGGIEIDNIDLLIQ